MCEQVKFGFPCVCDHKKEFPGSIEYVCEFCGLYHASKPRCGRCEVAEQADSRKIWPLVKK